MPEHPIPAALKKNFAGLDGCGCARPQMLSQIPPQAETTYPMWAWCLRCGWLAECIGPNKPLRWYRPSAFRDPQDGGEE